MLLFVAACNTVATHHALQHTYSDSSQSPARQQQHHQVSSSTATSCQHIAAVAKGTPVTDIVQTSSRSLATKLLHLNGCRLWWWQLLALLSVMLTNTTCHQLYCQCHKRTIGARRSKVSSYQPSLLDMQQHKCLEAPLQTGMMAK
eukprot:GHRR01029051.1.p1 GENE.GHRR01029051.1~~GHRR01029051.1.p1  ORF type:complete len:145 (+),score=41.91 GHRR01029051.1:717-1151(+)